MIRGDNGSTSPADVDDAAARGSSPASERAESAPRATISGGSLTLVATPLGNLADISPRATEALATADVICCEDTRRTGRLLELLGHPRADGKPELLVVNEHTEADVAAEITQFVLSGKQVALVSDAGLPALSDPGQHLVAAVAEAGASVTVIPGPTAGAAALAISGFAAVPHVFEGWVARRGDARDQQLRRIVAEHRTLVLFESPHRVTRTLADLAAAGAAERRCVVARELTKLHEEVLRGTVAELAESLQAAGAVRGEIVLVLADQPPNPPTEADITAALRAELADGLSRRDAAHAVATRLAVPKRTAYELCLAIEAS